MRAFLFKKNMGDYGLGIRAELKDEGLSTEAELVDERLVMEAELTDEDMSLETQTQSRQVRACHLSQRWFTRAWW